MKISQPDDFFRKEFLLINYDDWRRHLCIPYCFDFSSKEIIYTSGVDPVIAANSVFHYEYLRENAAHLISLPWELRLNEGVRGSLQPVFIFSPGRCGSTLLSNVIRSVGAIGLSEPDIYAQALTFAERCSGNKSAQLEINKILACATEDLLAPLAESSGGHIAIKMRRRAIHNPQAILSVCNQRPKTIFLIRHFQTWAESLLRVYDIDVSACGRIYCQSLLCYQYLLKHTECMLVKYEELNGENRDVLRRLSTHLSLGRETGYCDDVFTKDSQEGTYIQEVKNARFVSPEMKLQVREWWKKNSPRELIDSVCLNYLVSDAS